MKRFLTLMLLAAVCICADAEKIRGKVVCEADHKPVAYAGLQVEYVDTIISYDADRKGNFSIEPKSFPLTVTAKGAGMIESAIGLMSMPDTRLIIELTPNSSSQQHAAGRNHKSKPDWSTAMPPRLRSTYVVRVSTHRQ